MTAGFDSSTKILFTDLDDTLLDSDKNVSPKNRSAISAMLDEGHRFVIATGRPLYSAKVVARELNLYRDGIYLTASNGGVIFDCGSEKVISAETLSMDTVDVLFKAAKEKNMHIHTYTDDFIVSTRVTRALEIYSEKIKMPYRILEKIPEDLPKAPPKLIVMSIEKGSRHILEGFEAEHASLVKGKAESVFSNDFLLEYLPVGVSKGNALIRLCDIMGIPVKNSVAAGDEANDIPMLRAAGVGVAVNNATDAAKLNADYVTERTNNESAVSEVIEKFILSR